MFAVAESFEVIGKGNGDGEKVIFKSKQSF